MHPEPLLRTGNRPWPLHPPGRALALARVYGLEDLEDLVSWPVARIHPQPLILWSASNRVVHFVNSRFFGYHYSWCSPVFDASAVGRYARGAGQPPSSDPVTIYRNLHAAVTRRDEHDPHIARQKKTLASVALQLSAGGSISDEDAKEVVAYLDATAIADWWPVIYVIPYAPVAGRVLAVPRTDRASAEPEYVIPDLKADEFEVIEPLPCP